MTEIKYLTVSLTKQEKERIFSRIAIDPETGCWNWTGCLTTWGYAQMSFRGNPHVTVHRLLYACYIGPIPEGFGKDIPILDHQCNNPKCCNPTHLKLVTHKTNILRGDGPPAINARKTHCIHGHLLPVEPNRKGEGRHGRDCLICRKEYTDTDEYREKSKLRMREVHRKKKEQK